MAKLIKPAILHLEVGDAPETVVVFGIPLKSDGTLNWKVLHVGSPINQQHRTWRQLTHSQQVHRRHLVDVTIAISLVNAACCLKLCLGVAASLDEHILSEAATSALATDYLQSGIQPLQGPRKRRRLDPELRKVLVEAAHCGNSKSATFLQKLDPKLFRGSRTLKEEMQSCTSLTIRNLLRGTQLACQNSCLVAASDAGTIGGKKLLFTCVFNKAANVSMWLPPQDSRLHFKKCCLIRIQFMMIINDAYL